ncbi:hypothetical protein [Streptomyces sp. NPDC014734]
MTRRQHHSPSGRDFGGAAEAYDTGRAGYARETAAGVLAHARLGATRPR